MLVLALTELGTGKMVQAQLAFHLAAGVDLVLVPDVPAGRELARAQEVVRTVPVHDGGWDEAATRNGGSWLVEAGSGEFWWPRGGSLADLVRAIPGDVDAIQGIERRLARSTQPLDTAGPAWRGPRLIRRPGARSSVLRGWFPVEILRFEDAKVHEALRLLSAGRSPAFPRPGAVDDPAFGVEIAALFEEEVSATAAQLAVLESRVERLEARGLRRRARRLARRVRRWGRRA